MDDVGNIDHAKETFHKQYCKIRAYQNLQTEVLFLNQWVESLFKIRKVVPGPETYPKLPCVHQEQDNNINVEEDAITLDKVNDTREETAPVIYGEKKDEIVTTSQADLNVQSALQATTVIELSLDKETASFAQETYETCSERDDESAQTNERTISKIGTQTSHDLSHEEKNTAQNCKQTQIDNCEISLLEPHGSTSLEPHISPEFTTSCKYTPTRNTNKSLLTSPRQDSSSSVLHEIVSPQSPTHRVSQSPKLSPNDQNINNIPRGTTLSKIDETLLPSDLHIKTEKYPESDTSTIEPPTFSDSQRRAWHMKKKFIYEKSYCSSSSCEVKTPQHGCKSRRGRTLRHFNHNRLSSKILSSPKQAFDEDKPLWAVAKVTNLRTADKNACILQILNVSDEPPCTVSKKTIGILVVSKFQLNPC